MSAYLSHCGLPNGMSRNELRRKAKIVLRKLEGMSEKAVALLDILIDSTQDTDFEAGRICGSWMSPATLADLLEISERRVYELESELEGARVVLRTSGRRPRHGQRAGHIRYLFGLNLAPLIERALEIAQAYENYRKSRELLNQALVAGRAQIRDLLCRVRETGEPAARDAAESVLPGGRSSRIKSVERLEEVIEALRAIVESLSDVSARDSAHQTADDRTLITTDQSNSETCSRESQEVAAPSAVTLRQALAVATPEFVSCYDVQSRQGWLGLADAAQQIAASSFDINQRTWGAMCHRWGPETAALSVILIDRHRRLPEKHPWSVKKTVGGCFVGLMRNPRNLMRMFRASESLAEVQFSEPLHVIETAQMDRTGQIGNFIERIMPILDKREIFHERH